MTRINALRNIRGPRAFLAWGKTANYIRTNIWGNVNALVFAAVLVVCSVTVGCSSEKPQPISSPNQISVTQAQSPSQLMPAPTMKAENKSAPKKVVHKKPATVNYTDKTYGVTFEYPRRYAIETGNAATDLLDSSPMPMNFVAPGGVALAAVELPETNYANTDFSSAYFDVSVHKGLTADQCNQFAVPQPKVMATTGAPAAATETASTGAASSGTAWAQATSNAEAKPSAAAGTSAATATAAPSEAKLSPVAQSQPEPQGSKLMLGDLELRATEAVSGEGIRQSDAKYFHVYQNGACYEFALNVTTVASSDGLIKHIDRDKVFNRLEQILSTVKINPVASEVTAEAPATPPAPGTPAQ